MNKLSFVLLVGLIACNSTKEINSGNIFLLQIDFQDGFDNDTISMSINNYEVFDSIIINSGNVTGQTGLSLVISRDIKYLYVKYFDEVVKFKDQRQNKLEFKIGVNRLVQEKQFDALKGKYIGLNNDTKDSLIVLQSLKPFLYE